jgi:hypothetical protein
MFFNLGIAPSIARDDIMANPGFSLRAPSFSDSHKYTVLQEFLVAGKRFG